MSSSASLQQQLDRLRVPHSAVQQAAVAAVFAALHSAGRGLPAGAQEAAVRQCLLAADRAAAEAAVQQLLKPGPGLFSPEAAHDLLLSALAVATPGQAAPLADGLLQLFAQQHCQALPTTAGSSAQGSPTGSSGAWRAHPLSKALLANGAATQPLLLGICRLLSRAAAAAAGNAGGTAQPFEATLAALSPFFSFLLLDEQLQAAQPLLAPSLRSCLGRVACGAADAPAAQQALARLLVAHLPCCRLASSAQQAAAAAAVAEVMDVLEGCGEEPDAATVQQLASVLVALCFDAAAQPAEPLLLQLVGALQHVAGYWPHLLLPHTPHLAALLLQPAVGSGAAAALLRLLAQLLHAAAAAADSNTAGSAAAGRNSSTPGMLCQPSVALLLLPLLQQLAFSGSKGSKQWASHCLSLLLRSAGTSGAAPTSSSGGRAAAAHAAAATAEGTAPRGMPMHGEAAGVDAAEQLLGQLWAKPSEARAWLASLRLSLGSAAASSGKGASAREQHQLHPSTLLLLCGLLQHPQPAVQQSAAAAAAAAARAAPLLGLTLLPLLVQQLQQRMEGLLSGREQPTKAGALLSPLCLLRTLPEMAQHPAALPFVLRALQPLLGPGSPELLQAVGLRLLCRLWSSTGRGYQQLRTAILGFAAPGSKPPLDLRAARLESVRGICTTDPDRGIEYVQLLQEGLSDEAPEVQAIALDCIALLCESDALEFYGAWRVVHRTLPTLPAEPATAAAWVRLLGCGGLDATVHPETASAVVDALWLAAAHASPAVRRQAYASLAAFQFGEEIGALRALCSYVALLRAELLLHAQQQERQESAAANPPLNMAKGLGGTTQALLHQGGLSRRRQARQARHALAECEALVQAALASEHASRRRVSAAGGASVAGTAAGTGAAERGPRAGGAASGAAALHHRLQSALPKQMLGGGAASAAELLPRLPNLPPAAVLLFYAPPAPSSQAPAAAAAAARQAAGGYQALCCELLAQPLVGPQQGLPIAGQAAAAGLLAAWQAFLRRWAAALRASSRGAASSATGSEQASAAAAMQQWEVLQGQLSGGHSVAAEGAAWAAAALVCSTPQPLPQLVTSVLSTLSGLATGASQSAAGGQVPTTVRGAALAALGALAERVHTALGLPAVEQLVQLLQQQLPLQPAAAATGLGMACSQLCSRGELAAPLEQLVREAACSILGLLPGLLVPQAAAGELVAAAAASGLHLSSPDLGPAHSDEGLLPVVASAAGAAAAALRLPALLQALHSMVSAQLQQAQGVRAGALCSLLGSVTAAGVASSALGAGQLSSSLQQLLGALERAGAAGAAADGRIVGAAAAAVGSLVAGAQQQGYSAETPEEQPPAVLERLLAAAAAAGKLPHAAAAKVGVAAGVAGLVKSGALGEASSQLKAAVALLEQLALADPDPRVCRGSGWPLALLCHAIRRGGSSSDDGSSSVATAAASGAAGAAAAASKSLQQLAADGAMRPLLQSLLEGSWALPEEDGESAAALAAPLSAYDAAAALRCLAAAERLPAMNYTTLCRRLLRAHAQATTGSEPAAAVGAREGAQGALVAFVAAHGGRQYQQQYQLAEFAGELLAPQFWGAAGPSVRRQLLLALPQLLGAVPEATALSALQQVCHQSAADPALLTALFRGLRLLLAADNPTAGPGSSSTSPGLLAAVQASVPELLPQLPQPPSYPLNLSALQAASAAAEAEDEGEQQEERQQPALPPLTPSWARCWAAALRCLAALPARQLEALFLEQPQPFERHPLHHSYAAAALVASGVLDARALQHPRNLVLNGGLGREEQQHVALLVGQGVAAALAPAQQLQWLLEGLGAIKGCANPQGGLELAACIAQCCASQAAAAGAAASGGTPQVQVLLGAEHALAPTCATALSSLPSALELLLEASSWHRSGHALLHALAAALQHLAAQGGEGRRAELLLQRCLMGVRANLPPDLWAVLAATIHA